MPTPTRPARRSPFQPSPPDCPRAATTCPRMPASGSRTAAEGLLGGRWPVLGRQRDDMAPAPDWFLDPTTGRRAPDRTYCFDIDYRDPAAVGDVKQVWEPSRPPAPDGPGGRVPSRWRRAVCPGRRHPAPVLVGGQPLPVRHPLDQRHRARHATAVLDLDPAAAGRLARGRAAVRGQPRLSPTAPPPPGVADPVAEPRVVGQQPPPGRDGRAVRRRLRVPLVPGEHRLARDGGRDAPCASWPARPSPAA